MTLRAQTLHNPYLVGNGRWCSCCFPAGPPMDWSWRTHARRHRGCNECAGAGRILFTAEEIVAATVAEARTSRERNRT
jgi:hypothetical protein